jgi:hypothetical protein
VNGTSGASSEQPVTPPPPAPAAPKPFTGRAAFAIDQIYYYAAAVVGVGFVIGGAIGVLIGLRQLVLPMSSETSRTAIRTVLDGMAFALPGVIFAWWHLSQARAREGRITPGTFWGRSLYFNLVSFVAAVTALGGVTGILTALADAALQPTCPTFRGVDFCNDAADELRGAINAAIVVIVAGAVWWWHRREAIRAPVLPTDSSDAAHMMEGP